MKDAISGISFYIIESKHFFVKILNFQNVTICYNLSSIFGM
jgi:uncharacterized membrane protein